MIRTRLGIIVGSTIFGIIIIGIGLGYFANSTPVITYEINTECELFERLTDVFGGYTSQNYHRKIQEYAMSGGDLGFGPGSYLSKMEEQYVKDLMWNYKINPDLESVVAKHAHGTEYVKCEK